MNKKRPRWIRRKWYDAFDYLETIQLYDRNHPTKFAIVRFDTKIHHTSKHVMCVPHSIFEFSPEFITHLFNDKSKLKKWALFHLRHKNPRVSKTAKALIGLEGYYFLRTKHKE